MRHVPAKVIVKEVSERNTFLQEILPEIKKYADIDNLTHLYEENNDPLFVRVKFSMIRLLQQKQRLLLITMQIVFCQSLHTREPYTAINDDQVDVIYPYGCGIYQWKADFGMDIYDEFVKSWNGTLCSG